MPQDLLNRSLLRGGSSARLAALLSSPGQPALPLPGPGTLGIVQGPGRIGFTLNGALRWLIDVQRFGGAPVLSTRSTLQLGLTVELTGALFPGTGLPADFICVLQPKGLLGTPVQLTFTLGGFRAQGVMERWLAGQQLLQSSVNLNATVCSLGAAGVLSLAGAG
jgi:hypothetical protein